MSRTARILRAVLLVSSLSSCRGTATQPSIVWTDIPEFAFALESFGSPSIELYWKADLAAALASADKPPALAIGRYLEARAIRGSFVSLDYLLKGGRVNREAFYPSLLEGGRFTGRTLLLPISFNLPLLVFPRASPTAGDGFTLSLAELLPSAAAFNKKEGGAYTRMGFSPRWDGPFLVQSLKAGDLSLAEGRRLEAAELASATALGELLDWTGRANGPALLDDDFQFKYLFSPPYRWAKEGRTPYAAMDSSSFFLAPEERRAELDFRWFRAGGRVPISEGSVYAGLPRGAPGRRGAEDFLCWLLRPESQRAILERTRQVRAQGFSFGLMGGFSALRSVNEEAFPAFFPELLGHAPPAALLASPPRLSEDWPSLEKEVVIPWALEATSLAGAQAQPDAKTLAATTRELYQRIVDFRKRRDQ